MPLLYKKREEENFLIYEFNTRQTLLVVLIFGIIIIVFLATYPPIGMLLVPLVALIGFIEIFPYLRDERQTLKSGKKSIRRWKGYIQEIWLEK